MSTAQGDWDGQHRRKAKPMDSQPLDKVKLEQRRALEARLKGRKKPPLAADDIGSPHLSEDDSQLLDAAVRVNPYDPEASPEEWQKWHRCQHHEGNRRS